MKFCCKAFIVFLSSIVVAWAQSPREIDTTQNSQTRLKDRIFPVCAIDALRYGYEEGDAQARKESFKNIEKVVPEEREILKRLHDYYKIGGLGGDGSYIWISVVPIAKEAGGKEFHTVFLSLGREERLYDFRDLYGTFYCNELTTKDLETFKHLQGLSVAVRTKFGGYNFKRIVGMH